MAPVAPVPELRPVSAVEEQIVRWFADRLEEDERQRILLDLQGARAEELDLSGAAIEFHLVDYSRPKSGIQRPLPVDARVTDADGAMVLVEVLEDENARLFGLELHRVKAGELIAPDWATLREMGPEEVVRMGIIEVTAKKWGGKRP